jgi:hypothetical protein
LWRKNKENSICGGKLKENSQNGGKKRKIGG